MSSNSEKPNIVYILVDDMGYGDLSCNNADSAWQTPNLDALASSGLRFTDAHSSSAVCTPTRYGILTGRYNWRSRLKAGVVGGYTPALLEKDRTTVAGFLREHGYHTACVGKWHVGITWPLKPDMPSDTPEEDKWKHTDYSQPVLDGPCDHGFDTFFGISASLDMPPYVFIKDNRVTEQPSEWTEGGPEDEPPGKKRGVKGSVNYAFWRPGPKGPGFTFENCLPRLTEKAVEYVRDRESSSKPFFLYLPLPAPHTPIVPTPEFRGKSGTNPYGDFCLMVDRVVGKVVSALSETRQEKNTVVIFASDNGCSPSARYDVLAQFGHNPSYIYRGHKADIWEGGHRIPLLVRWPGRVSPGAVTNQTVCLTDLFATSAEILGAEVPEDAAEDSISNLPLWLNPDLDEPVREATVHHSISGMFSIRQGPWKLEMCPGSGGWSKPTDSEAREMDLHSIQLYDVAADPGERTNVVDSHPEIVKKLTALLTDYVEKGRSTPGRPQENTGPGWWPQLNWIPSPENSRS
ncbi:MAG: arylsulfatase [Kiritimatiellia bacterium]